MAKFKIDDREFDTDKLSSLQKRVIDLYQRALKDEAEAVAALELKRAKAGSRKNSNKRFLKPSK